MAALRFEISADSRTQITRLGHQQINASIHTWDTRVNIVLNKDGSGSITVSRKDTNLYHRFEIHAEGSVNDA